MSSKGPEVHPFPFRKFREKIAEMGLSRAAVAEAAGMNLHSVNKICQGQRCDVSHSTIQRLAHALGVSVSWFFTSDLPEAASHGFGPGGVRL